MKWTDEIGRAKYYLSQARALFARAKAELKSLEDIERMLASLEMFDAEPYDGYIPDDARTALHQTSLALVNVRGSLKAAGKEREAYKCENIRGEIIDWFDDNADG